MRNIPYVLLSILDNVGEPVTGTLTCYVKGTQDLADTRDPITGAQVSNPIHITQGRTPPFTVETDLTLVVKDTSGTVIKTETWFMPRATVTTEGVDIPCYESISDLRAANHDGLVCLLGYYEAGDKTPQYYAADDSVTEDDGGASIVGENYCYRMLPTHLCAEDYGIFPSATRELAHANANPSQWTRLAAYSNTMGIRVYVDPTYYEVPAMTIAVKGHATLLPTGTINVDIEGEEISFDKYWNGTAFAEGYANITAAKYTSSMCNISHYYEVRYLVMDENVAVTLRNATIDFQVSHTSARNLTNCVIYSNGMLMNNSSGDNFKNLVVDQAMFHSGYTYNGTYVSVTPGAYTDFDKKLKILMAQSNNIDLESNTITELNPSTTALKISHGTIDGAVTFPTGVSCSIILENVTLTENASIVNATSITLINCSYDETHTSFSVTPVVIGPTIKCTTLWANLITSNYVSTAQMSSTEHSIMIRKYHSQSGAYYYIPTGYYRRGSAATDYRSIIRFDNVDGATSCKLCLGYWENDGVQYASELIVNPGTAITLIKVDTYTSGSNPTHHLEFKELDGTIPSNIQASQDPYYGEYIV